MPKRRIRTEYLQVRITPKFKKLLRREALLNRQTVTAFIEQAVTEKMDSLEKKQVG